MAVTGQAAPQTQTVDSLPYASFSVRAVAFILDTMVASSVFAIFVAVGGLLVLIRSNGADDPTDSDTYTGIAIALSSLIFLPWYFIATWWWKGQSLGMMAVHIAVTDRDGHLPTFGQAFMRAFVYPLSFIPLATGFLTILFDHQSRALHDMLAGTVVLDVP